MTARPVIIVRMTPRWWVWPFIHSCIFFALAFGFVPDVDKMVRTIKLLGGWKFEFWWGEA